MKRSHSSESPVADTQTLPKGKVPEKGNRTFRALPSGAVWADNAGMDAKELQTLRRQRLITLRDDLASGNTAELARMANLGDTYIRNMIAGRKTIGEKTARKIEENLDLIPGYLDIPPEKEEIVRIFESLKSLPQSEYEKVLSYVQFLLRSEAEK